jgi:hypothetical protein
MLLLLQGLAALLGADDYIYTTNNGTITINRYTGSGGTVSIPSSINGLPVTAIGDKAFWRCKGLASVTMPNSVTSIGNDAFRSCDSLTNVTIGKSVTSIGRNAFSSCHSLTSVTIPHSVATIGDEAFKQCNRMTNITIGNNVTNIGDGMFFACGSLTNITIPSSVTRIGRAAFDGCTHLTGIYFQGDAPDRDGPIGSYGDDIPVVYYPPGTKGWYRTFGGRPTEPWTPPSAVQFEDYNCWTDNRNMAIKRYTGSGGAVTVPSTIDGLPVVAIRDSAFEYCTNLTNVTIPKSVTTIGDRAFRGCTHLQTINIPHSVTTIGDDAFDDCRSLTSITIPTSVTNIGDWAFRGCTNLQSITIPNSVTKIGRWTFDGCRPSDLTIDMTNIEAGAFSKWGHLTCLTIGNNVTRIGDDAFSDCTNLAHLNIGTNVTTIGVRAFQYCSRLTNVTIPDSVTSIEGFAFEGSSLTNVIIPNSVTNFGTSAFDGANLSAIAVHPLNPSYSSIDGVLFDKTQTTLLKCPKAKAGNYTIPKSVTTVGFWAFHHCHSLTSVSIPERLKTFYGDFIVNDSGLSLCYSMSTITVDPLNPAYSSVDGVLFDKTKTWLLQYPSARTGTYTIPNSVIHIRNFAFHHCIGLTNVTIPNSVTTIGDWAFADCTNLTNVTIPSSVTNIWSCAFRDCTNLKGLYFMGNAPTLDYKVFDGATNAIVYYNPGTTGWGPTFGDRPTALAPGSKRQAN